MSHDAQFPRQQQERPGVTGAMARRPRDEMRGYRGSGLLEGRRALSQAATRGSACS